MLILVVYGHCVKQMGELGFNSHLWNFFLEFLAIKIIKLKKIQNTRQVCLKLKIKI